MLAAAEASFLPAADGGQRLYLHHEPAGGRARAALLYVHPWAEEMNKSRRMAAMASRMLAADGCAVLQVDLLGCGDSSGDFGDASWDAWIDDLTAAAAWLGRRHPAAPIWWWGLRTGALLARAAAVRHPLPGNFLFWQPTVNGRTAWQQFLRIKAASRLADGGGKAIVEAARADLAAGRPVDVAGYTVQPALAQGLENAALDAPEPPVDTASALTAAPGPRRMVWLEVSARPDAGPSPAAAAAVARWQAAGWASTLRAVPGPAFWQTTEIEEAPQLLQATVEALGQ